MLCFHRRLLLEKDTDGSAGDEQNLMLYFQMIVISWVWMGRGSNYLICYS